MISVDLRQTLKQVRKDLSPDKKTVFLIPRKPVQLTPIPWGKPDKKLGFAVCAHLQEVTPGIEIPWSPQDEKIRRILMNNKIGAL